ncbi:MAG TPA: hypothetical protein VLL52_22805 [Anaerolineae bacterium]|nr:hypothetical protein [Anaerolineae bacterium]
MMEARHSAREGIKFLGKFSAECRRRYVGAGAVAEGREGRGGGRGDMMKEVR